MCQFREAETNKCFVATTSYSTRYEEGVLKILHDLGGGAKILHDYAILIYFNMKSRIKTMLLLNWYKKACVFKYQWYNESVSSRK